VQVREFISGIGVENIGKRLINSREGKVNFEKPSMPLDVSEKNVLNNTCRISCQIGCCRCYRRYCI
jgi:hypothetical protein